MKTKNLKIGELVRINKVPPKVTDSEIDTLKVFKQSLGKTFPVVGISAGGKNGDILLFLNHKEPFPRRAAAVVFLPSSLNLK